MRPELKDPLGPIYTETAALLSAAGTPIVAVGDIVTYHLLSAGRVPDVALIDERTERSAVDDEVRDAIEGFDRRMAVENPPGTLTVELIEGLTEAIGSDRTTLVEVDGEEDLAALPAVATLPAGGSVVYGQPDEGMVLVDPDGTSRTRVRSLLERMDGDTGAVLAALD